jgi:hypothetical protein
MLQQSMQALPMSSSRVCSSVSFLGTDIDSSVCGVLASLELFCFVSERPGFVPPPPSPSRQCRPGKSFVHVFRIHEPFPNREDVSDDPILWTPPKAQCHQRRWHGQVTAHVTLSQGLSTDRQFPLRIVRNRFTTNRIRGNTRRASRCDLHYDRC